MSDNKNNTDALKESLLIRIDRSVKISRILNNTVNEKQIQELTEKWIELMEKDLEDLNN
ncbi:hypothetical protein [uncultured Draconibacterium sp.]|uniref:hypothetical protein n=1 Tax=uncultured Draconibacterium sp. TaxID=1573823 RepID=UPI0032615C83